MSQKIRIGTVDAKELDISIPELINSRMVVQGSSGSGKSGIIRVLCERISKFLPFILFDPEGEYATLREKVDLILVGPRGDIPADLRAVEVLMRKLVEMRVSAVVDISDLQIGHKREYVARAATALVGLPKELWLPEAIILDEAHLFAPERASGQKDVVSTLPVADLVSRGRKRGFAIIPVTQRFSKLHNDVLAETKNVFIGSCWLDADQKKAADYIGLVGNDRRALRDMPTRTFYCFGPALSIKGTSQVYIDSAESTFPKAGQIQNIKLPKASDAISDILGQLDDLPEAAEAEKRDIASLKAENAGLKKQLAERPTIPEPVTEYVDKEIPVMTSDVITAAESLSDSLSQKIVDLISDLENNIGEFQGVADQIRDAVVAVTGKTPVQAVRPHRTTPAPVSRTKKPDVPPGVTPQAVQQAPKVRETPQTPVFEGEYRPSRYQMEILTGLAELEAIGIPRPTRRQLGFFASKTPSSGHFQTMVSSLKTAGFVEYPVDGCLALTSTGRQAVGDVMPPESQDELHRRVRGTLAGYQQRIFDALVSIYPDSISREDLASALDTTHTSGHFQTMVSALKSAGVLTYPTQGQLRADDLLFPEGLN